MIAVKKRNEQGLVLIFKKFADDANFYLFNEVILNKQ